MLNAVSVLKEIDFQFTKDYNTTSMDTTERIRNVKSMLKTLFKDDATRTEALGQSMPTTFLGCTLTWNVNENDNKYVRIQYGLIQETYDVTTSEVLQTTDEVVIKDWIDRSLSSTYFDPTSNILNNVNQIDSDYFITGNKMTDQTYSYLDNSTIFMNNSSAMTRFGSPIKRVVVYNGKLVAISAYGTVASFDGTSWTRWDGLIASNTLHNDGSCIGNVVNGTYTPSFTVINAFVYNEFLVIVTADGKVSSYDGLNWKNFDGSGTGNGPYYNLNTTIYAADIWKTYIILSGAGNISSYDGTNWKKYDGNGNGTGPYVSNCMLGQPIYVIKDYKNKLLLAGGNGSVASFDGTSWRNSDGSGIGTGIYCITPLMGLLTSAFYNNSKNTIAFINGSGYVSSFDGTNWKYYNGTGTGTGPWTDATYTDYWGECATYQTGEMVTFICNAVYYLHSFDGTVGANGIGWKSYGGVGSGTGAYGGSTSFNIFAGSLIELVTYNGDLLGISDTGDIQKITNMVGYYASTGYNANPSAAYYSGITKVKAIGISGLLRTVIFNDILVYVGGNGRVASYNGTAWKNFDGSGAGTGPYNSGIQLGNSITDVCVYNNNLLVSDGAGRISSYDGTAWKYYDGTGTGTGYFHGNHTPSLSGIIRSFIVGNILYYYDIYGKYCSFDGTNWKYFDGTGTGTGFGGIIKTNLNLSTNYSIVGNIVYLQLTDYTSSCAFHADTGIVDVPISYNITTFFYTNPYTSMNKYEIYNGKYIMIVKNDIVLFDPLTNNIETKFTSVDPIFNYAWAQLFQSWQIKLCKKFGNKYIFVNQSVGYVSSFDGLNWKYYNNSGTGTGPYSTGISDVSFIVEYNSTLLFFNTSGYLSSWDGTNWKYYNGTGTGTGLYSMNSALSPCWFASVEGSTLLVWGGGGKLSSYDGTAWKYSDGTGTGTGPHGDYTSAMGSSYNPTRSYSLSNGTRMVITFPGVSSVDSNGNIKSYNSQGTGTGPHLDLSSGVFGYINCSILIGNTLIIGTSTGKILSFDGTNWKYSDGTGTGTGPYGDCLPSMITGYDSSITARPICNFTPINGNAELLISSQGPNEVLLFNKINLSTNVITYYRPSGMISGNSISSAQVRGYSNYPFVYDGNLCILDTNCNISSFDGVNWKYWDGTGTGTGLHISLRTVNAAFTSCTLTSNMEIFAPINSKKFLLLMPYYNIIEYDGTNWSSALINGRDYSLITSGSSVYSIKYYKNNYLFFNGQEKISYLTTLNHKYYSPAYLGKMTIALIAKTTDLVTSTIQNINYDKVVYNVAKIGSTYVATTNSGLLTSDNLTTWLPTNENVSYDKIIVFNNKIAVSSGILLYAGYSVGTLTLRTIPFVNSTKIISLESNGTVLSILGDNAELFETSDLLTFSSVPLPINIIKYKKIKALYKDADNTLIAGGGNDDILFDSTNVNTIISNKNLLSNPFLGYNGPGPFLTKDNVVYKGITLVFTSNGLNCYSKQNGWKMADGTGTNPTNIATKKIASSPQIYINGDYIYSIDSNGYLSSYDGTNWKYWDGSGTGTGPYSQRLGSNSLYNSTGNRNTRIFKYKNFLIYPHTYGVSSINLTTQELTSWDGTVNYFSPPAGGGSGPYLNFYWQSGLNGNCNFWPYSFTVAGNMILINAGSILLMSFDGTDWKGSLKDGVTFGTGTGPYYYYNSSTKVITSNMNMPKVDGVNNSTTNFTTFQWGTDNSMVLAQFDVYHISSFDGTNWKYWDGSGTGTGPHIGTPQEATNMSNLANYGNCWLIDQKVVYLFNNTGGISSMDSNFAIKKWDGTGTGTGLHLNLTGYPALPTSMADSGDTSGNQNAYAFKFGNSNVFIMGNYCMMSLDDDGKFKLTTGEGTGAGPYCSPLYWEGYTLRVDGTETAPMIFKNQLIFNVYHSDGTESYLASWDGSAWKKWNGIGSGSGLYGDRSIVNNRQIYKLFNANNETLFILPSGQYENYASYDGFTITKYNDISGERGEKFDKGIGNSKNARMITYGTYLVIFGEDGKVSYFDGLVFHSYKENTFLSNDGGAVNYEQVSAAYIYDTTLVIGTVLGKIASFDGVAWKYWDGSGSGVGFSNTGYAMNNRTIYSFLKFNNKLIVAGDVGYLASFDGLNWKNYNGSGSGSGPFSKGRISNSNQIYKLLNYNNKLVVVGSTTVSSFDGSNWKYWDGSGDGTGIYVSTSILPQWSQATTEAHIWGDQIVFLTASGWIQSYRNGWKTGDGFGTGTGVFSNSSGQSPSTNICGSVSRLFNDHIYYINNSKYWIDVNLLAGTTTITNNINSYSGNDQQKMVEIYNKNIIYLTQETISYIDTTTNNLYLFNSSINQNKSVYMKYDGTAFQEIYSGFNRNIIYDIEKVGSYYYMCGMNGKVFISLDAVTWRDMNQQFTDETFVKMFNYNGSVAVITPTGKIYVRQ